MTVEGAARRVSYGAMLALASLLGSVLCGCSREPQAPPTSVMLITIDTLRADRLSCYGYAKQKTPAIDVLARDGALFEQAVCDIPWTTGSMASVMTGTFSTQHGLHLSNERLSASRLTLAEVLKQHGFQTGAVVGSFPLAALYGINHGFDSYDDEFSQPFLAQPGTPAPVRRVPAPADLDDMTAAARWAEDKMRNDAFRLDAEGSDRAIAWLRGPHPSPFFLWVHYFGPHERLFDIENTALSWQQPRIVSDYDGDLQKANAAVERLLAAVDDLGLRDRLLVILHADHGQSLGEHAYVGHSEDLYDASIRVPLLMRFPGGIPAGTRVHQLVRNVDIMPTILDFLRVPIPPGLDGRSLLPGTMRRPLDSLPAYSETYIPTIVLRPLDVPGIGTVLGPIVRVGIRTENWKVIENRISHPCARGTGAFRTAEIEQLDQWVLRDPEPIAPEECDRIHVDELYDVVNDPGETQNVAAAHPDVVQQLRQLVPATKDRAGRAESFTLSPADKERLRSLGYTSGDK